MSTLSFEQREVLGPHTADITVAVDEHRFEVGRLAALDGAAELSENRRARLSRDGVEYVLADHRRIRKSGSALTGRVQVQESSLGVVEARRHGETIDERGVDFCQGPVRWISALSVFGPKTPSAVSPASCWNDATAVFVDGPYCPSTVPTE